MTYKCLISLILLGVFFGLDAQMTPEEAISSMKHGINLGNVLEAPYEGDWEQHAREAYFDMYVEAGFDLIRIPVRWDKHTGNTSPYRINETWMQRVEEVVGWGLERDLFVVLNSHHDNWIKEGYDNPVMRARFDSIWSQISIRFKDKPDKLIFEILNEPKGLSEAQNNEMHERVLGIIRRTNPTRNVIVQGNEWGGANELVAMEIPDDPYIIGSFHSYDPWPFGLEGSGSFGSSYDLQKLEEKFVMVRQWSDTSKIPVFLGEFACHTKADYNSRMNHYRAYVDFTQKYGFTPVTWDCGSGFQAMDRRALKWLPVKEVLMHSGPFAPRFTDLEIVQDTLISLHWRNGEMEADSFWLQRKSGNGDFQTLAVLGKATYNYTDSSARQNEDHYYRIIAAYPGDSIGHAHPQHIHLPAYLPQVRAYYLGYPHPVPGIIEAEDFDLGGEGLSYHELDTRNIAGAYRPDEAVDIYAVGQTAYHLGNMLPGEWAEYSIEVAEDGDYHLGVYCAAFSSGGRFSIQLGEQILEIDSVVGSGSLTGTLEQELFCSLKAGEQIMRLTVLDGPSFNIDKFVFTRRGDETASPLFHTKRFTYSQDASDHLHIRFNDTENRKTIRLYNLWGQMLIEKQISGPSCSLSCQGLQAGIYLLLIKGDRKYDNYKIILE